MRVVERVEEVAGEAVDVRVVERVEEVVGEEVVGEAEMKVVMKVNKHMSSGESHPNRCLGSRSGRTQPVGCSPPHPSWSMGPD